MLIIAAVAGYLLGVFTAAPTPSPDGPDKTPTPAPPPPETPEPPPTPSIPPDQSNVNFDIAITDISGSGLSWTISAQLTNTGNSDAHHVWAKVEVFSAGSRVKLNGQDYLRIDIGTLPGAAIVTRQVTLNFGAFDGLKISRNGAEFVLTIASDEHTEALSYEYQP